MRTILIFITLCVACDDDPATTEPVETAPADEMPEPTAPTPEPTPAAPETTTGFIEANVDGELKRYEYLAANDNRVLTRLTKMTARADADSEEGFELLLLGWDVRTVELPMVFKHDMRAAITGGDLSAAGRMPNLKYRDAEGTTYMLLFNDDSLECQSLENLLLKCTFSGTLNENDGDRSIEITDGRAEVLLTTDTVSDAFVEGTVGAAADESTERVQEAIDGVSMMN
jgi:hypothetical protein